MVKAQERHVFSVVDEADIGNDDCRVKLALKIVLGVLLLFGVGALGWWVYRMDGDGAFSVLIEREKKPQPDEKRYDVLVEELRRWREDLAAEYRKARTEAEKAAIEHDARVILEMVMPEMMRCWLGTPYDFNGTAEKPGSGKIACGYFVSTVIRDAGFKVDRYKLAQQPSENIMRTFLPAEECLLQVGKEYNSYVDLVESKDRGVYLIGLDTHVGFIVNRSDGMRFIHSSGSTPLSVVEQTRKDAGALERSNWRMLGGLTGNAGVVKTWLVGDKVKIRSRSQ